MARKPPRWGVMQTLRWIESEGGGDLAQQNLAAARAGATITDTVFAKAMAKYASKRTPKRAKIKEAEKHFASGGSGAFSAGRVVSTEYIGGDVKQAPQMAQSTVVDSRSLQAGLSASHGLHVSDHVSSMPGVSPAYGQSSTLSASLFSSGLFGMLSR